MQKPNSPYGFSPYRDYDVHLLVEDEARNYLLNIGRIYERHSGEISGDTIHGTLIMRRLKQHNQEPDRFIPTAPMCSAAPFVFDGQYNA